MFFFFPSHTVVSCILLRLNTAVAITSLFGFSETSYLRHVKFSVLHETRIRLQIKHYCPVTRHGRLTSATQRQAFISVLQFTIKLQQPNVPFRNLSRGEEERKKSLTCFCCKWFSSCNIRELTPLYTL